MLTLDSIPGDLGKDMEKLFLTLHQARDQINNILGTYAPNGLNDTILCSKFLRNQNRVEQIHEYVRMGMKMSDIADDLGLTRFQVYRGRVRRCSTEACFCKRS